VEEPPTKAPAAKGCGSGGAGAADALRPRRRLVVTITFPRQHHLGQAEQAGDDSDEVQPIGQQRHAEHEALLAGIHIRADQAQQQAQQQAEADHADRVGHAAIGRHDRGDQAERHQRAVRDRGEAAHHPGQGRRRNRDRRGGDRAAHERADGGYGQRAPPRRGPAGPWRGHPGR
jgi:hypothetical protein